MTTIDKALDVLDVLAEADAPIGLTAVVERMAQPKPTVRRLLLALIQQSLAMQNSDGKYELGGLSIDLAAGALSRTSLSEESRPALTALRRNVHGTITLSRYSDHGLTAIQQLDASSSPFLISPTANAPMYATASGKAILAYLMRADVARVVDGPMTALTPRTLTDPESLIAELDVIRARGYAIEDGEVQLGVRALAAPVRTFAHRPIGAVSVAAPSKILSMPELTRMASHVVAAAEAISERLGGTPLRQERKDS